MFSSGMFSDSSSRGDAGTITINQLTPGLICFSDGRYAFLNLQSELLDGIRLRKEAGDLPAGEARFDFHIAESAANDYRHVSPDFPNSRQGVQSVLSSHGHVEQHQPDLIGVLLK